MDKLINKSGLQTALEPIVRLIDKKAERPDWNENNPASASYIEGRPFYEETKTETNVFDVAEFTYDPSTQDNTDAPDGLYIGYMATCDAPYEDAQYIVKYDESEYRLYPSWQDFGSMTPLFIGNLDIIDAAMGTDDYADNGLDFLIGFMPTAYSSGTVTEWTIQVMGKSADAHQFSITAEETVTTTIIEKIPKKFLPAMSGASIGAPGTGEGSEVFNMYNGRNTASGDYSHAEGIGTGAAGHFSHAEGCDTTASEMSAHAEGGATVASGEHSHAEGESTTASGMDSHAEGCSTKATVSYAHAEGVSATASGSASHAEGNATIAASASQHAQGKFNIEDSADMYAHIVGNGTDNNNRSNAHTLDWDGNAWFAGDVYVGSTSGTNKDDGSKILATKEYVDSVAGSTPEGVLTIDTTDADAGTVPYTNSDLLGGVAASEYALKSDILVTSVNSKTGNISLVASDVGAAPTAHASSATTYGIGNGSNYGHVKLSDSTSSTSAASAGIAASPAAVKAAYDLANSAMTKLNSLASASGVSF